MTLKKAYFKKLDCEKIFFFLLLLSVMYIHYFRFLHLDGELINRHSWGESQYAMMAKAYMQKGFFWGMLQGDQYSTFTNYIPVSSLLAALLSSLFKSELVITGRTISFFFSLCTAIYFYRLSLQIFKDRFKASASLFIFTILPINMYFSMFFYNEPIHLYFIVLFCYLFIAGQNEERPTYYYIKLGLTLFIVLITKPTSVLFCLPLTAPYIFDKYKNKRLDIKEICSLFLPIFIVCTFIVLNRIIHPNHLRVESDKLIDYEAISNWVRYANAMKTQLVFEFSTYIVAYLAGLVLIWKAPRVIRACYLVSLCYFLFIIILIKGAVIHQYYSLPFTVSFSIIVAHTIFTIANLANKNVKCIAVVAGLALLAPSKRNIDRAFKAEYSKNLLEVLNILKEENAPKKILALGKGHRIFQYYFNIPSEYTLYKISKDNFAKINHDIKEGHFDYIIVEKSIESDKLTISVDNFHTIYKSQYIVYKKKTKQTSDRNVWAPPVAQKWIG